MIFGEEDGCGIDRGAAGLKTADTLVESFVQNYSVFGTGGIELFGLIEHDGLFLKIVCKFIVVCGWVVNRLGDGGEGGQKVRVFGNCFDHVVNFDDVHFGFIYENF